MQQNVAQTEPTELQLHVQKFITISKSILVDPTPKFFNRKPPEYALKL